MNAIRGLPVNLYTTTTIEHAWEVLLGSPVDVIFCDDSLPDGTYPDFLCAVRSEHKLTRFVLLLNSEELEDYLEAIRLGASEVIRCPYQPMDVELLLIRAARDARKREELYLAASA